ncbi:MAG: YceI family protein [Bacteroidota bacterium]
MKKQSILLWIFTLGFSLFLTSFIGYDDGQPEAPGTIEFIGDAGSPNVFVFQKWQIDEVQVPDGDMEQVQVKLTIQTGSLQTQWKDLEKSIRKKKDYFYAKKFPRATVTIDGAKKMEDGTYTTTAMLTLKGVTKAVDLNFTASETAPYQIKGSGVITRQKFKFTGGGPKDEVPVNFEVSLPAE